MKKALLVDDVRLFLELEKTLLKNRGLEIFTAMSGEEAIEIHRREKVDLILCDLNMPGMSGLDVCRAIRGDEALKKVSIIMVTTRGSNDDLSQCLAAGANDFIAKPINRTDLLEKIGKYGDVSMRTDTRLLVRLQAEGTTDMSETFAGMTRNLSSTGFLLETAQRFEPGETATFNITFPGYSARVAVKGEVAREAVGPEPEKSYGGIKMAYYGVRFTEVSSELKEYIDYFVKSQTENQ